MATQKELEQKVAQLEQQIAALAGGRLVEPIAGFVPPEQRRDYIEFGSDGHLGFLGLAYVDNIEEAKTNLYTVYISPDTKKAYRLIDEMQAVQAMRPMDPDKSILMVLRQKVSAFESGPPKPFPGAPPRFNPEGEPGFTPLN
jgi:hypothetical protein